MYIEKHFLPTTFSLNCIQMRVFENGIGRSPRVALLEGQSILVVEPGLGRASTAPVGKFQVGQWFNWRMEQCKPK